MVSYLSPSLRVFLFLPTISLPVPHSPSAPSLALSAAPPYLTISFYLPPLLRSFTKHLLPFPTYVSFSLPFLAFRSSSPPAYLILPFFSSFSLFLYLTPLVSRPLFRSSPMTESLEQATLKRKNISCYAQKAGSWHL